MNIVVTVPSYYPEKDGVQNITQFYCEYLAIHNDVTVITELRDLVQEEKHNNVHIVRIPIVSHRLKRGTMSERSFDYISELLASADVIMNVCLQTPLTDVLMPAIKEYTACKILYVHGMVDYRFPTVSRINAKDIIRWIYNNTYWRCYYKTVKKWFGMYDVCIHLHEDDSSYRYFEKNGIHNNAVIENGVLWETDDEALYSTKNGYFLCVSRFTDAKNQRFIIDAYLHSDTTMDLILIGNTENHYFNFLKKYEQKIKKKLKYVENKHIKYLTSLSRKETERYIINAYAILNGSKSEKYPVTICEAMFAAIPFISTDVGIVKHLPGGLIAKDEHDMARKINILSSDNVLYSKLSSDGKKYSEIKQSMQSHAIKLEELIVEGAKS